MPVSVFVNEGWLAYCLHPAVLGCGEWEGWRRFGVDNVFCWKFGKCVISSEMV